MYDLSGKRVWVAGHQGMVGLALMRRLAHEECELLTVDRSDLDLRRQSDVEQWLECNKPDVIIIAAAHVGGILANSKNPAPFFYNNIMIAANIMHAAYINGVDRLIFLGSSCIYPRDCEQPIVEESLLSSALEPTNEAYALAKIGGLKMAEYYNNQYGCDFFSAMPCNLYGVGDRYDEVRSHVIPALIMKIYKAKMRGEGEVSIWGSGTPLREFLYVDDLADALILMLRKSEGANHINIGSGAEISIYNLAKIICSVVGYEGCLTFDSAKPDGAMRKCLDNRKIKELGWSASVSLEDGIRRSYADFLRRFDIGEVA